VDKDIYFKRRNDYMSVDIINKMELEVQLIINKNLYEEGVIDYNAYQSFLNYILKLQKQFA